MTQKELGEFTKEPEKPDFLSELENKDKCHSTTSLSFSLMGSVFLFTNSFHC